MVEKVYSAFHYLQKCIKERILCKTYADNAKKSEEEAKKAANLSKGITIIYWDSEN